MKYRHLYEIVSPTTRAYYMVWVEEYEEHFYAIKFHLRRDKKNSNKYSVLTGFNEARPIIMSCMKLLVELANKIPDSSFGFIGAGMVGDDDLINTKRFRVYKKFTSTFISEDLFEHRFNVVKSTYLLLRRSSIQKNPNMPQDLYEKFSQMYSHFE